MRAALAVARRGLLAGEAPVGACIVQDGKLSASAHTAVAGGPDATAHAEILAIRAACRSLRSATLAGCALYVSVEPCSMCLAACHYAGIQQVFFAASLADMQAVTGHELGAPPPPSIHLQGGVLAAEAQALLAEWAAGRRERLSS
jgi:tRNA(Arg) A34 adenosine deaminase TadA